jgi:hypothetical protein
LLAALMMIIWNYNKRFLILIDVYNTFCAFVCLKSMINSKKENLVAGAIIGTALIA